MEQKAPHILRMKNGMSSMPSDVSSPDDALSAEVGMLFENGEHRVIQKPIKVTGTVGFDVLYIHDFANYTHLIGKSGTSLVWGNVTTRNAETGVPAVAPAMAQNIGNIRYITSIGNTVIVSTDTGLRYFLWENNSYKNLGSTLPNLEAKYTLVNHIESVDTTADPTVYREWGPHRGAEIGTFVETQGGEIVVVEANMDAFKNAIVGHVADVQNQAREKGFFIYPFWVRVAYQLYDGSNAMVTNPVLMLPCVRKNDCIIGTRYDGSGLIERAVYFPHCAKLGITLQITAPLSDWRDIITGVDVYISDMVCPFDIEGDWKFERAYLDDHDNIYFGQFETWDGIRELNDEMKYQKAWSIGEAESQAANHSVEGFSGEWKRILDISPSLNDSLGGERATFITPTHHDDGEIMKRLIDNSQFYRAAEIDIDSVSNAMFYLNDKMHKNVLLNITSQHQLAHDDYFDHYKVIADTMFAYNGRLHIGGVHRGLFTGYGTFLPSVADNAIYTYQVRVTIETNEGEKTVARTFPSPINLTELIGYWFYYPDPRAKEVEFVLTDGKRFKHSLKPHPWLHGAYFLLALPSSNDHNLSSLITDAGNATVQSLDPSTLPANDNSFTEYLPSQLMVSEVSNPFLFTVDGFEEIGSGRIYGLVSNTEAVSEGQFGQYPLYAFTSEGIWALATNSTGLYDTIRPLSREVCNNPKSIVQTDNAVFFTTRKGLMRLSGSKVVDVSQQMMGKHFNVITLNEANNAGADAVTGIPSFHSFIQSGGTRIFYDYPNYRLWLYNITNQHFAYVFSMRTGAFALFDLTDMGIQSSHILYPDTWIQDGDWKMRSMMDIQHISVDDREYTATMLTRPVSFGSPTTYKQIEQIEHLISFDASHLALTIWGSNDTRQWAKVPVLRGRPWRYYRFLIHLTGLSAADAYSGMVAMTEARRNGRLHPEDWHSQSTETQSRPLPGQTDTGYETPFVNRTYIVCTLAQYNAMPSHDSEIFYIIIADNA